MKNRKVAVVIIGDEILLGRVTDTNSGFIARAVDQCGGKVVRISTVGDSYSAIRQAIETAFDCADIVFTTGGLGPTKDDITKTVLTDFFGGELVRDKNITENIRKIFEKRNLRLNTLTLDQALVPSSASIIQNRLGTAPIMIFSKDSKILVSMPGVPFEMEGMLPDVMAYLQERFADTVPVLHHTWIISEISESALSQKLEAFENSLPVGYKLAYLPDSPIIKLRLDSEADDGLFNLFCRKLDDTLRSIDEVFILGEGEKTLGQIVVERLARDGLTLSTAESCTGGNIARVITGVPGSSAVFNGGVVSYANSAKINVLDVGKETLEENGAVSRPVVIQMVDGVSRIMSTTCAVSTSGIAGPTGGTPDKPVGTVWMAVKTPNGIQAVCHRFPGNRTRVIQRATATALILLLKALTGES